MQTKKIAYLTDSINSHKLSAGDNLLIKILEKENQVDLIPWEENIDWSLYDLTMIRTTWDYMPKTEKYLNVLEDISKVSKLINPIETIKWNINKKYLLELKNLGHPIIPTSLHTQILNSNIEDIFNETNKGEGIIIKPTIGASSIGIQFLHSPKDLNELTTGEWFVQPFQKSIQQKGEFSLFYFGGDYSHAINKMPKVGEFRSQEEFDSIVTSIDPTSQMKELGFNVLKDISVHTDYARVDIILDKEDNPQIVELELIEPCLFFKYDKNGAQNFASHILKLLKD